MTKNRWFVAILAIVAQSQVARADDWPQWGGPKRDGVWRETGIIDRIPAGGPKILWRIPVGAGYSGPAVVGNRLYVMDRPNVAPPAAGQEARIAKDAIPGSERVLCIDAASGAIVWSHSYDCPYQVSYPSGPRTTPTVVGNRVYTLGTMGDLLCLDAATGQVVWSKNFRKEYGLKRAPAWGWSSSPLVIGDRLYSLVGGEGSAVVCFDAANGKEVWRGLTAEEVGYAPLLMTEIDGKPQIIAWHTEAAAGLDPATGAVLWTIDYPIEGDRQRPEVNISAPVMLADRRLFLTNFYHGATLLKLPAGPGDAKVLWNLTSPNLMKPAKGLHTVMSTPVVKGKHVYGICGHGELRCMDIESGERIWETLAAVNHKRGLFAHAFLTEQGDRFWIYNDQGDLLLAKLSPLGYEELGRCHLLDTTLTTRGRDVTWCHPAYANRCAYVRNDKEMVCVSLAAEPRTK